VLVSGASPVSAYGDPAMEERMAQMKVSRVFWVLWVVWRFSIWNFSLPERWNSFLSSILKEIPSQCSNLFFDFPKLLSVPQ